MGVQILKDYLMIKSGVINGPCRAKAVHEQRQVLPALGNWLALQSYTYCLLKLALVALDFALQLVNQLLHSSQVLSVLFSLKKQLLGVSWLSFSIILSPTLCLFSPGR